VRTIKQGVTEDEVPLVEAAIAAGESWPQTWRRLLRGELTGRKVHGRWFVLRSDVQRIKKERERAEGGDV